jgi:Zn-dependent peptidase ImmA (M78 family)
MKKMRNQKTLVKINPKVLKWTIDSTGWSIKELSKKTEIEPEQITQWQSKISSIELPKLERIAVSLKKPLAVFFLPEPPKEEKLTDYRKIAGFKNEKASKKTLDAIRNARYVQSSAHELFELQNMNNEPKVDHVDLKNNPEEIALYQRRKLNFEFEIINDNGRIIRKPIQRVYKELREKIESMNIFVLQSSMPINEVRGFTLTDKFPRIIVVNSKDDIKPRMFTLLHEYAHILLKKDGMCLPNSENFHSNSNETQLIEKWCNAFAGSLLMPKKEFLTELTSNEEKFEDSRKIIENLSKKFRVSKKAIIVRILNLSANQSYKKIYLEYYDKILWEAPVKPKKKGGGAISQADKCISQKGRKYVQLVSDSKNKQLITTNSMISYLNLKIKHFDKLQSKI